MNYYMICLSRCFHIPLATGLSVQKIIILEQCVTTALKDLSDILTQDEIGSNLSTASQWWDRLTVTWLACLDLFYIPLATGHICPEANYKKEQGFIPACLKIWAGPACPDPIYLNAIGLPRTNSPQFAWQLATTNLFDKIRIWTGCLNPGYKRIQLTSKDWRSMVCLTISYFQLV